MRLGTAPELPRIASRNPSRIEGKTFPIPFAHVMKSLELEIQKPRANYYRDRKKSQEIFVPSGLKTYTETNLQEISIRSRFKEEDYKKRYTNILRKNPHAFYKLTGEFTLYSDFSVKINRVGPYNKRK